MKLKNIPLKVKTHPMKVQNNHLKVKTHPMKLQQYPIKYKIQLVKVQIKSNKIRKYSFESLNTSYKSAKQIDPSTNENIPYENKP